MSQEVLLSGLIGALLSSLVFVIFSHHMEYQKLRIGLLDEFTKYYDNVFRIIFFMTVYKRRQSEDLPLLERHAELYSSYNNQLRELQLSSNIDVKIRALYSDQKFISLHSTLAEETNELISLIRRTRSDEWEKIDASITAKGEEMAPLWRNIENIMINKIKKGGFCEICLPTFYSLGQKLIGWKK